MISAQTLRVCREGKPLRTFPDHALALNEHTLAKGQSVVHSFVQFLAVGQLAMRRVKGRLDIGSIPDR